MKFIKIVNTCKCQNKSKFKIEKRIAIRFENFVVELIIRTFEFGGRAL